MSNAILTRAAVAVAALTLAASGTLAPAAAETKAWTDLAGDGAGPADIRGVAAAYEKDGLTVAIKVRDVAGGGNVNVYVDSRTLLKGPELVLFGSIRPGSPEWIAAWVDKGWVPTNQAVLCDTDLSFLPAKDIVLVTFGMGCLRNPDTKDLTTGEVTRRTHWKAPASVKVAALTGGDDVVEDWSPKPRRFYAAIDRG